MIVTPLADSFLVVQQADHARFAAELLALFRNPEIRDSPQRELLLRAIAEHDNGWWESDAAPGIDAAGAPAGFLVIADSLRLEIWRRGIERHAEKEPGVAALVATHALRIFRSRREASAEWNEFLIATESRRDELAEAANLAPELIVELDTWMALADGLALTAAAGDAAFAAAGAYEVEAGMSEEQTELRLHPFPLAGATTLNLACRYLPRRKYGSGSELGSALATARWQRRPIRIAPRS